MRNTTAATRTYRANLCRAWRRVDGSQNLIDPDGYRAIWKGRAGWWVYSPAGELVGMGGVRNADGSHVYTDGVKL